MEEKTGIHRLDSPKRAPFDAFVYVNRIPDKAARGRITEGFRGPDPWALGQSGGEDSAEASTGLGPSRV